MSNLFRRFLAPCGLVVALIVLLPAMATAQSAIAGLVTDTSGAVLPGVTVEAASPVLIEKVRTVVTDSQGRYTIVDLRPGVYVVKFTLPGFTTLQRDGLELPAAFTATVNASLRVGAVEESITVTGASPVVDVQSTQKTTVISRELLDSVPTARNASGIAALVPGVRMSTTDVGGNQQIEQIYMFAHGSTRNDTTTNVDGILTITMTSNNSVQPYLNDAMNAETSVQTSGIGAESSQGGVRINMIPKDGGNTFSGNGFFGGSDGRWQSNNVDDNLRARGLVSGNRITHISDWNFAMGGPIIRDRLWFYSGIRRIETYDIVPNTFHTGHDPRYKAGDPGAEEQWVMNMSTRLTSQVTPRNKFAVSFDRTPKHKEHTMSAFEDPDTAAGKRDWKHNQYYTALAKWTSPVTSRLLLETGTSIVFLKFSTTQQPGIKQERGTPLWYSMTRHQDLITGVVTGAGNPTADIPERYVLNQAVSYITGTHSLRVGGTWAFGSRLQQAEGMNGDLIQLYQSGVPSFVTVANTPREALTTQNADIGIYAQDSWTRKRLTMNLGVRFDYLNEEISEQSAGQGRFAPARHLDRVPDTPNWLDVTPRLGVVYDLFGTAKTAIKASFNKYMQGQSLFWAGRYNPLGAQTERRTWTDLNRDDIAQDSEIGPSPNAKFGLPVTSIRDDGNLRREYSLVYEVGIQHQLMPGLGMSGSYVRRGQYNQYKTTNVLVSQSDYTPIDVYNPLNGQVFQIYNLAPAKFGLADQVDSQSTDSNLRRQTYNGVELAFTKRMSRGTIFGGFSMDHIVAVICDGNDPNTFRFCDARTYGIPFRKDAKLAGSYLLPADVQVNVAFQSYSGDPIAGANETFGRGSAEWTVSRTTRYPSNCPAPCPAGALVAPTLVQASLLVQLVEPGTVLYPRQNQLDLGFRKLFRIGRSQLSGQVDIFNVGNSNRLNSQTTAYGPQLGTPTSVLQPRTIRLAMQMKF